MFKNWEENGYLTFNTLRLVASDLLPSDPFNHYLGPSPMVLLETKVLSPMIRDDALPQLNSLSSLPTSRMKRKHSQVRSLSRPFSS
jgi:hypothetical protein